jgi:hypothetical protein
MKKISIEKTLKKFNEFTEEEQEQILDNYRYINVEDNFFNDYLIEEFIDEVKEKTDLDISNNNIIWEVGSRNSKFGVYSKTIVNDLISKFEDKGVYDIYTTDKLGSFLNHLGGGICNKNHTKHDLVDVYFEDTTTEETKKIVTEQINKVLNTIIDLCSDYHSKNEEVYDYYLSDEAVKETIEANEYDFDTETLRIY